MNDQSDYCSCMGAAVCTLLWRVSRQQESVTSLLGGVSCKVSGKSWFILCGKKLNFALTLYLVFLLRGIQKLLDLELFMSKFFMFSALIDVAVASLVHSSLLLFVY